MRDGLQAMRAKSQNESMVVELPASLPPRIMKNLGQPILWDMCMATHHDAKRSKFSKTIRFTSLVELECAGEAELTMSPEQLQRAKEALQHCSAELRPLLLQCVCGTGDAMAELKRLQLHARQWKQHRTGVVTVYKCSRRQENFKAI